MPDKNVNNTNKETPAGLHRRHRYRKHSKSKESPAKHFSKWMKKNPSKTTALLSIGVIVFLTALFYKYDKDLSNGIVSNPASKDPIKGIMLPATMAGESSPVVISFGKFTTSVPLEELRSGYTISPAKLVNCTNDETADDPTKFTLNLINNRLYVNASFIYLANDSIAGSVQQKQWTAFTGYISGFRSDDKSFQVSDKKGNSFFSMQFFQPDSLLIQGYFVGHNCVYVVGQNSTYSSLKTGDYIPKALLEIKKTIKN